MKKQFISVILLITILIFNYSLSFAAINFPPIPKDAMFIYSADFNEAQKATINKYVSIVFNDKNFESIAKKFNEETGAAFPKTLIEKLTANITNFTFSALTNEKSTKFDLPVLIIVTFNNANSANDVYKEIKVLSEAVSKKEGKEVVFNENQANNVLISKVEARDKSKDHLKDRDIYFFVLNNYLGMLSCEKGVRNINDIVENVKSAKNVITSEEKFKKAVESVGKDATSIIYLDSNIAKTSEEKDAKKFVELVSHLVVGGHGTDDFSKINLSLIASFNEVKDPESKKMVDLIKQLLSNIKRESSYALNLPSDVSMFVDLKLNITQELLKVPEIAQVVPMLMMMGVNLDEDLLSWFEGEIFLAFGDFSKFNELKEKNLIPEVYLGLRSKNAEKANKFVEKLINLAKMSAPQLEAKDETISNIKIKVFDIQALTSFEGAKAYVGQVGSYLLIATSKESFEKVVSAVNKKENSLSEKAEFKSLNSFDSSSFLAYFVDVEKSGNLKSQATSKPAVQSPIKNLVLNASLKGNDIVGTMILQNDLSKITAETISNYLQDVVSRMSQPMTFKKEDVTETKKDNNENTKENK